MIRFHFLRVSVLEDSSGFGLGLCIVLTCFVYSGALRTCQRERLGPESYFKHFSAFICLFFLVFF